LVLAQTASSSDKLLTTSAAGTAIKNPAYNIFLDQATIVKGYTVSGFDNNIKLSLLPNLFSQPTKVEIQQITDPMPEAWKLTRLSPIYQFDFANKSAYDNTKPFYIQLSYSTSSPFYKQVYFFDKNYNAWRPLPTQDYPLGQFVRARIHLPFARLAVFADPTILTLGRASWYKYKGGNFAASPDFPKGSRLRVFLIKNGQRDKFVDVVVNDYGPDRSRHSDRVLDLDKVAFASLSSLSAGIINVLVEPLYIAPANNSLVMAQKQAVAEAPKISAQAAVVMDGETGDILYAKAATTTRPIASLTKIVAIYTFLTTRPSLNKVVVYRAQDEEYNYKYCSRWESARLHIKDGESLTIQDLIYSSLVGSANNTVETLARVSGLARDQFIARMNETVKEWGAKHTHFVEPTGLSPENVSTAQDYALIAAKALQHPIIAKASTAARYEFVTVNTKKKHIIRNTNYLVRQHAFPLTGSKTGYLDEAKYCLMVRAGTDPKHQIIAVVLGAPTRLSSEQDIKNLVQFGLKK
jgi:D-alanyl-D-alanine endopeptidase (penicillin-binding protein 7)